MHACCVISVPSEGDGGRVMQCWKLYMPHFIAAGHTKYALDALKLQMQVNATLSPNLAHQVMWNRFVNTRGGLGRNIPGDLHNEHVNKLLKHHCEHGIQLDRDCSPESSSQCHCFGSHIRKL